MKISEIEAVFAQNEYIAALMQEEKPQCPCGCEDIADLCLLQDYEDVDISAIDAQTSAYHEEWY